MRLSFVGIGMNWYSHFDEDGEGGIAELLSPAGRQQQLHLSAGAMLESDFKRLLLRQRQISYSRLERRVLDVEQLEQQMIRFNGMNACKKKETVQR